MENYEENRVKWLIDKPGGLFLTRRRRSLCRAGGKTQLTKVQILILASRIHMFIFMKTGNGI